MGQTTANPVLKVVGLDGSTILEESLSELKSGWQNTLLAVVS